MRFNEIDTALQNQMDFVPRARRNELLRTLLAFVAILLLIAVSAYAPTTEKMGIFASLGAIFTVSILSLYVLYLKQKNLDLVMATEYQNMLLTQALTLGCSFCLLVRRDGTILYASEGMKTVFPGYDYAQSRSLDGVFELGLVRSIDRERIMGAIYSGGSEHVIFPIFDRYSARKEYIITVEPLPRPSGFCVVRGREYYGQRNGAEALPDMLRATTIDKLDHLLAHSPIAHYTTDPFGRFEYINPALEKLCGYEAGEMIEMKLCFHHLFMRLDSQLVTEEYGLHPYNGTATLLHKKGTHLTQRLVQHIIRDANGKLIGATGSILAAN